ncbi:MAG: VPLPA-CTERM sorting domain-containing protein [Octadecabacter sp.]
MKNILLAGALTVAAGAASAVTLDFDTVGDCSGGAGVTLTTLGDTSCSLGIMTSTGSTGLALIHDSNATVRADFSSLVSFVSIDMGDYNADPDNIFLEVFDSLSNSLGYVDFLRAASSYDMDTLALSVENISYAIFGTNGSDLGYIGADNLSYSVSAVPLPAGGLLLLSGMGGLAFVRRRKAIS